MAIPQSIQSSPAISVEEKIVKVQDSGNDVGNFTAPRAEQTQEHKVEGLATRLRRTKRRLLLEAVGLPTLEQFRSTCFRLTDDGDNDNDVLDTNSILKTCDSSSSITTTTTTQSYSRMDSLSSISSITTMSEESI